MPVIFRHNGYRFFFYSNEGDQLEPLHVHVFKDGAEAKFWLQPDVNVAYNSGFNARALAILSRIVADRSAEIESAWHDTFA
ncbi:MAG: DUF4160 domain-containing protein [Pseudomonadota bacterium]